MNGWATLWIETRSGPVDVADLVERARQLDEVGALLALRDDVSGVQTFEAAQSENQRPSLCVYTIPSAINAVRTSAIALLDAFGVAADLRHEHHDDEQWREAWKQFYRPLVFGEHQLLLRPSFIARSDGDPAAEIVLDPGRAFGTGLHQSTQLCLDRLCALARDQASPTRALDLGCGSGVLALAALRLFPDLTAVAIDIDPEAAATAAENAELNELSSRLEICTGDIDAAGDDFALVTANIRPNILIPLAPTLRTHVRQGADVVLSGILTEELEPVKSAWQSSGFTVVGSRDRQTWSALDLVAP